LENLEAVALNHNYTTLTSVNLSGLDKLQNLNLNYDHNLTDLTFPINTNNIQNLQFMDIGIKGDNLTNIINNLSLPSIQYLLIEGNELTSLDFSGITNVQYLDLQSNRFTGINLSGLNNLLSLNLNNNNILTDITFPTNITGISTLQLSNIGITGDNLANLINNLSLPSIQYLSLNDDQLTSLDFSRLTNVQSLYFNNDWFTGINLSGLNNLQLLSLYGDSNLTDLTFPANTSNLYDLNL